MGLGSGLELLTMVTWILTTFFCSLLRAGAGVWPQFPSCLGEQLPVLHKLRARLYPGLGIMVPFTCFFFPLLPPRFCFFQVLL